MLFLKLGTTAFGGPAAHIAMMEDEVVRRRGWLSREKFLDLLGATNLIPGPNSTEMAIHIGYLRAGWPGLVVSGACFILPAAIIVAAFAWAYVNFATTPQLTGLMYGVKPVIIAIVLQALWNLGRAAVKTKLLAVVGFAGAMLSFLGVNELLVLFGSGSVVGIYQWVARERKETRSSPSLFLLLSAVPIAYIVQVGSTSIGPAADSSFGLWPLFLFFLKVGSVLFGSGYVLLAFLRGDLVERWHWLTNSQLLDAIAVGQVTPGPVFTTATFIGYFLSGFPGALVATLGIFVPAFFFVAISGPLVPRIRKSSIAGAFLDGVNIASLVLLGVVTFELAKTAIFNLTTVGIAAVSAVILLRFRVNSAWLVLGGALIGLLTNF